MFSRVLAHCLFLVTVLLTLGGCNKAVDLDTVDAEVIRFRQLLDTTQFDVIYEESSDGMKASTKEQDLVRLLDALHRKLGASKSAERKHADVARLPAGTFVTMIYTTSYAAGPATEHFVYHLDGDTPRLYSFNVNSPIFVR